MKMEKQKAMPRMLTTEEAAEALYRRPQTLRTWACKNSGPIKPVRIVGRQGAPLLWRESDVLALLQGDQKASS